MRSKLQLLVGLVGVFLTFGGLVFPIVSFTGATGSSFRSGAEYWFVGLLILSSVFIIARRFKGAIFSGLCLFSLFVYALRPLWVLPEIVTIKWCAALVLFGILLIIGFGFLNRKSENDATVPVSYKWPLIIGGIYLGSLLPISLTGEASAYLLYYINLPIIHFLKLEAALRVSWINVLQPIVGFLFYFLGTLSVVSLYKGVKEPTLSRICFSFFGFILAVNLSPNIAAPIYDSVVSSEISQVAFPDSSNSDACKNTVLYSSRIPGGSEIWSMDEFGRNKINLSAKYSSRGKRRSFDSQPLWSPDGKKILFSAERNDAPGVYLMSCDGAIQYMVARTGTNNNYPTWAPDSEQIAYSDMMAGLTLVDYTGKNARSLLRGRILTTAFSPDGKEIAYVNIVGPDASNIELLNIESGERKVLIADGNYNIWPKWLSKTLLSYATDLGKHKLYPPIDYEKKAPYLPRYLSLSNNTTYEVLPDSGVSSGNKLTLVSKEVEKKNQIVVVGADGKTVRQLTSDGWNNSPDLKPGTVLEDKSIE